MSLILKLRGSPAVSAFRLDKLNSRLAEIHPSLRVTASEYWHFAEVSRPLAGGETAVLERLLDYGEQGVPGKGPVRLVVPRLGTISPWSSKATDIALRCGLDAVRRVERGTAWFFGTLSVPEDALGRALALVHDRMTETVLASADDADALFARHEPRPLAAVPLA